MLRTAARKASSRGAFGLSQRCCRQGFSLWCSRMRRTVSAEMLSTTPLPTSWRAISAESQRASERPSLSGSSHAILTAWIATSGGKDRPSARPGLVGQPGSPDLGEPCQPPSHDPPLETDAYRDLRDRQAIHEEKHHSCPPRLAVRGGRALDKVDQMPTLIVRQRDLQRRLAHSALQANEPEEFIGKTSPILDGHFSAWTCTKGAMAHAN